MNNQVLISWSTGKDSAYALYQLQQLRDKFKVVGLFTTLTSFFNRTTIHGVPRALLEEQAKRLNLSLYVVEIPLRCSNENYEMAMKNFFTSQKIMSEVSYIAFGDLFLEEVRHYREEHLAVTSMQPLFPLWHENTRSLANAIIDAGFRAIVTCVDAKKLDISFVGRVFDKDFIKELPKDVDPCGENGEFHTFVYAAPFFATPIRVSINAIIERDGFLLADLILDKDG